MGVESTMRDKKNFTLPSFLNFSSHAIGCKMKKASVPNSFWRLFYLLHLISPLHLLKPELNPIKKFRCEFTLRSFLKNSDWLLKIFTQLKAQNQRSVNLRCKFSLLDQPSYHTVV